MITEIASTASVPALPQTDPVSRRQRLGLIAVLAVLGFVLILVVAETALGALLQIRAQQMLGAQFAETLATAAGAAGTPDLSPLPVDPPRVGEPVAVLSIPAIGLQQVVVEGQDTATLQSGPGHVPGTSLPGQPGNASVVGRRTTFGAPFRNLPDLKAGDRIVVTTVEGTATYLVTRVGWRSGDVFKASERSVLNLVTSGPRLLATHDLVVSADLVGRPLPPTPQNPRTYASARAGAITQWAQVLVWIAAIAAVVGAGLLALRRRWLPSAVVWMFAVPLVAASLVLAIRAIDTFLPATL
ncbi:MAG: class E sortase [Actinomycetes bacterium]